ncbi:hypothetical protein [Peribacillus asahii]|uniref:hypothetical protein n=1 Tax=Peribacillus asahii TaxID=228899 RepID=UPI00207AE0CF|nr:hypothetical protein [Peribacillus asahii]USK58804.1 hypothetical protein LIT37_16470 [Peribacillus asahii]
MWKMVLQIFAIGAVIYVGYQNRYRLLNVALSSGALRRFLVTRSLDLPVVRDRMMQSVLGRG